MNKPITTNSVRSELKQALDECIELSLSDEDKREVSGLYAEGFDAAAVDPEVGREYVQEIRFFIEMYSREFIGYVLNPWGGLSKLYAHAHEKGDYEELSAEEVEEHGYDSTMRVLDAPILKPKEA